MGLRPDEPRAMTDLAPAPPPPVSWPVPVEPISREPISRVARPVMLMRWTALTYVHWRVDPDVVARSLPDGLTPDVHDGSAWIGLIPFVMRGVRPPGTPDVLPWVGDFPETNVRTYVVGPDGGRGVYFRSLEASRLGAVLAARGGYGLPYTWARMRVTAGQGTVRYTSRRRWPSPRGARSDLTVRVGARLRSDEVTELDDFLAGRWSLYVDTPWGLSRAPVDHPAWPLHRAKIVHLRDELVAAAGYGDLASGVPDHVRVTPGVPVRVGLPRRVSP